MPHTCTVLYKRLYFCLFFLSNLFFGTVFNCLIIWAKEEGLRRTVSAFRYPDMPFGFEIPVPLVEAVPERVC